MNAKNPVTVLDPQRHRANRAAHTGMHALVEFRDAEKALRKFRAAKALGKDPERYLVKSDYEKECEARYARANAALQKAIKEYERATLPLGADGGG